MLLPALHTAREKARQAVYVNTEKQFGSAIFMWANDHDGRAPLQSLAMATPPFPPGVENAIDLQQALFAYKYLPPGRKTLWCPSAHDLADRTGIYEYNHSPPPSWGPYEIHTA